MSGDQDGVSGKDIFSAIFEATNDFVSEAEKGAAPEPIVDEAHGSFDVPAARIAVGPPDVSHRITEAILLRFERASEMANLKIKPGPANIELHLQGATAGAAIPVVTSIIEIATTKASGGELNWASVGTLLVGAVIVLSTIVVSVARKQQEQITIPDCESVKAICDELRARESKPLRQSSNGNGQ